MLNYMLVVKNLGLSQHPNQLNRRLTRYPHQFKKVGKNYFISKQYASFLKKCKSISAQALELKKGGNNG